MKSPGTPPELGGDRVQDLRNLGVILVPDGMNPELLEYKLGIAARPRSLDRRLVRYHDLPGNQAVEVLSVDPESPASRAGIRIGDRIVSVNDQRVANVDDLHRFLGEWPIGEPITITAVRGKIKTNLTAVPVEAGALH